MKFTHLEVISNVFIASRRTDNTLDLLSGTKMTISLVREELLSIRHFSV